jgi:hypothetical protein
MLMLLRAIVSSKHIVVKHCAVTAEPHVGSRLAAWFFLPAL